MRKTFVFLLSFLILTSCSKLEITSTAQATSNTQTTSNSEISGEIEMKSELTLSDFCKIDFSKMHSPEEIISIMGTPNNLDDNLVSFILNDMSEMHFQFENDKLNKVFIKDISERIFEYDHLSEPVEILTNNEIKGIKSNLSLAPNLDEFPFITYENVDKIINISDFSKITINESSYNDLEICVGEPTGFFGSGWVTPYYQLADGSIIYLSEFDGIVYKIVIKDLLGRNFILD